MNMQTESTHRLSSSVDPTLPITVMTGATGGIGGPLARRLAQAGHTLVLLGRNAERLERRCVELSEGTGNHRMMWEACDLADLTSVRRAAAELGRVLPRIDVFVGNAGVYAGAQGQTRDGFETHLGINFLGPFLLTHLLLGALRAAPAPRIVHVAGETARLARLRLDDLNRRERYSTLGAYGQSKLALVMFSRLLAAHEGGAMMVNALQPAMAATDHLSAGPAWLDRMWRAVAPSPELGAKAVARLALRDNAPEKSGRYYIGRWWAPPPFAAWRSSSARRLYAIAADWVELAPAERLSLNAEP